MKKQVYVGMCADLLHEGHINIIKEAAKLGDVTVGLFTDKAVASYKRLPFLTYQQRKAVLENIIGVKHIIAQDVLDYTPNLEKLKPDIVVHGDDWLKGGLSGTRQGVVDTLSKWGGHVVDVPYTKGISSTEIHKSLKTLGVSPEIRRNRLRRLVEVKPLVRIMEVHDPMTALIVENTKEGLIEYDGMFSNKKIDILSRGKKSDVSVDFTSRITTVNEIFEITTKPLIFDAGYINLAESLQAIVKTLERTSVSAVVINDQMHLENKLKDDIHIFADKIESAKAIQTTKDFMLIAKVEDFDSEKDIERVKAYINAGADALMLELNDNTLNFIKNIRRENKNIPLAILSSNFNGTKVSELMDVGVNIIIYADTMFRAVYPNMLNIAKSILCNDDYIENEIDIPSIEDIEDTLNIL